MCEVNIALISAVLAIAIIYVQSLPTTIKNKSREILNIRVLETKVLVFSISTREANEFTLITAIILLVELLRPA